MDKAGWHTADELRVPENLSLVFLPPYSPELNPIERLFAAMHLNANLPAAYFGVPTSQVVEVGLEVEI